MAKKIPMAISDGATKTQAARERLRGLAAGRRG